MIKPVFSVVKQSNSKILITSLCRDYNLYLDEDLQYVSAFDYKYSDCYTIHLVEYGDIKNISLFISSTIHPHDDYSEEKTAIELQDDGYYNIYELIIPTKEWYDNLDSDRLLQLEDDSIYYTDGINFYERDRIVSFEEIIGAALANNSELQNTLFISNTELFNIDNLYKCYLKYCLDLINCQYIECNKDVDKNAMFIRDLIWMTYNVITYYVEDGDYMSASQTLLNIKGCSGICNNLHKLNKLKTSDCGCSQGQGRQLV